MYMLVILIFVTSAYQHNIARASDLCGPPKKALNTEPVTGNYSLNSSIRIQCVAGYVRKVGTSNLIRCLKEHDKDKPSWTSALPLVCIQAPRPDHQFTSSTTEINTPTISGTSTSITATGYITLPTTTNEVFTTKARTTNQPTLMSTTKEAEPITSTNAITASSIASSIATRQFKSTTSPQTQSSSFTTTTGISLSVKTTANMTANSKVEPSFARSKSTIGGVTSIFILCLAATLFILWWRSRRRDYTNVIVLQLTNQDAVYSDIPVSVIAPNPNNASIDSTAVIGTNHPQADSVQDSDSIHL
ncbi:interleukin-15 receptor subunit alpha isoform 3 precursor [Danio rerio]|uniref:Interleukin 15 receptor alpha isoform 2 n=1 Tax=Danio rerio TaxID=7955 RepID=B1N737_DANRE|nr:interleukin-15 receptor subunit alpha isoform 3 precursor [Danio rerio]ABO15449.1 interleukin 15 receptor alpha isoform 2 [Danio rerio]|eukprot:XP_005164852.1 zgc:195175 isoform X1 [Danio rerio]